MTAVALALPPVEDAAKTLGSAKMEERESLTATLWNSGPSALPLLSKLVESDDPEVSHRASYVYQRLRMGLSPNSPPELLELTNSLQFSPPAFRTARLKLLLEHPEGVPISLAFLNLWSTEEPLQPKLFQSWADQVTIHLLEQRSFWRDFLSQNLTARCRGAIVASLDDQNMPMTFRMIECLSVPDPLEVFEHASSSVQLESQTTYESLTRSALINNDPKTALDILFSSLAIAKEDWAARQIAFLEEIQNLPKRRYKGPWEKELKIFRYRAARNQEALLAITSDLPGDSFLAYENHLIAGTPVEISPDLPVSDLAQILNQSLLGYFEEPSQQPDIESLSSTITNEAGRLARGLYILGRPEEAAQIMAERHQQDFAIRILWMTGQRAKGRKLAESVMENGDFKARVSARLTLVQLLGRDNELEEARKVFTPFFKEGIKFDHLRRQAVQLAKLLFDRKQVLELLPEIGGDSPYRRQLAIAFLLPYPSQISVSCYERFLKEFPELTPDQLLAKVDDYLSQERKTLLADFEPTLAKKAELGILKSSDLEFQLALFLKSPSALKIVANYSWHRLATDELEKIILDESWNMEVRNQALEIALRIAPGSALLRAYDFNWNQHGDPGLISAITLGDPGEVIPLLGIAPNNEALKLTAEICDPNTSKAIQCLHQAAAFSSGNHQHQDAKRFFETALLGELVLGTQPGTQYGELTKSMQHYLTSRIALATSPGSKQFWEETRNSWAARK